MTMTSVSKKQQERESKMYVKETLYFRKDDPEHMKALNKLKKAPLRKKTDYIVSLINTGSLGVKSMKQEQLTQEVQNAVEAAIRKAMQGQSIVTQEEVIEEKDEQLDVVDTLFGNTSYCEDDE